MTGSDWLASTGLALTVAGALVLAWRDLSPRRQTWDAAAQGFPRTHAAALGFPLIAIGSALQIIAIAIN